MGRGGRRSARSVGRARGPALLGKKNSPEAGVGGGRSVVGLDLFTGELGNPIDSNHLSREFHGIVKGVSLVS